MRKKATKYVYDEKPIEYISSRVKDLRIKRGLTQEELANEAEIGIAQLKRIESGQVNTSISSLYRICLALDITLAEMFGKFK